MNDNDGDLLFGLERIAAFLHVSLRQARNLVDAHGLPTFLIGRRLAARRSALRSWLTNLEGQADDEPLIGVEQIAEFFGTSERQVQRMIDDGLPVFERSDGELCASRHVLDAWLRRPRPRKSPPGGGI